MTNINGETYVVEDTILAGNLSTMHLGEDTALMYIRKYMYAGQEKEKTMTVWNIRNVTHTILDNGTFRVKAWGHHGKSRDYVDCLQIGLPTTEVIVLRKVQK